MRLTHRLDTLARHLPPPPTPRSAESGLRKISEWLERYAPIPAGEEYADGYARLGAVLDRLHVPRAGMSLGARTAVALGMTTAEFRAALRARVEGGAR